MKETESAPWAVSPQPQPYSRDSVSFLGFFTSGKVLVRELLGLWAGKRATRPGLLAVFRGYLNTSQAPFAFQPRAAKSPLEKSASITVGALARAGGAFFAGLSSARAMELSRA